MIIISILAFAAVVGLIAFGVMLVIAPRGYEDEDGFSYGEPTEGRKQ